MAGVTRPLPLEDIEPVTLRIPDARRSVPPPVSAPVPAQRRLTFAALRALPARATVLEPPPPGRSAAASPVVVTRTPAAPPSISGRIVGMPVLAIGAPEAGPESAADVCAQVLRAVEPRGIGEPHLAPPAPTRTQVMAVAPAQPSAFVFDSIAPTTAWTAPSSPPPGMPSIAPVANDIAPLSAPVRAPRRDRLPLVATAIFLAVFGAAMGLRLHRGADPVASASTSAETVARVAKATARIARAAAVDAEAQAQAQADEPASEPDADPASSDPAADASPAGASPAAPATAARAGRRAAPRGATASKDHAIQIDSLYYGLDAGDRSVTLVVDGKSVIVREGDVSDDLQVKQILPNGVVFRRGGRLFAVYK